MRSSPTHKDFGGFGGRFGRGRVSENNPPPTELVVARWSYHAYGKFGGTGWSHNYPTSDQHISQVISEATNINVTGMSYRIVELGSPEVFDYPFAIVSEPGEMALTDQEVVNLREFVDRGGFVVLDDFDGPRDWPPFEKAFHRAFQTATSNGCLSTTRSFTSFSTLMPSTSRHLILDGEPIFYGLKNPHGDLAVIACYNNDLENFWDYIDEAIYPLKPSIEAFRLGINFLLYAMTR